MSDVLCLRLQEVPQELLGVVGRVAVPSQLVDEAALASYQRLAFTDVALCHLLYGFAARHKR
ncbi:hypothetical protein EN829_001025 [Mesorhizobium sp. M00.F.Ca.ET.186.01.1.1]|nr:hypothetical protein EN848_09625 [bacterium M00.F.Ca.ET.205.01.1.1]TGU55785.1 hypothetical protein EN795_03400 [bacterium M00.F.Ca.ET.152.01.1.1]TGV39942.1 hypothetical protein EN829_001025 [Mesorhizobium sp. M00.F.Ca.ET.186.01.1.1]TGZ44924.1 hypothetical protein EN805_01020 [bacterium M00.F.Ca.ET.162.01.1.1]